jgi:ankyrin repeat protein
MIWASFFGNKQIVEKLIRLGYSPFLKDVDQKNALMMAIEGARVDLVKIIAEFDYFDREGNEIKEKTKQNKDQIGNNALHYAYKYNHPEVVDILSKNNIGDPKKRNQRGQLPKDLER